MTLVSGTRCVLDGELYHYRSHEDDEQWHHEAPAKPYTLHADLRSGFLWPVAVP